MGRRAARANPDDPAVLREARPGRPAAGPAVRRHVARPPAAGGEVAGRGVLRPEALQHRVRRLPPHGLPRTAAGPRGSRVSALAPAGREEAQPVVLPAADEIVRFEQHVKPMFRPQDRQSMRFAFDLWSYDDVSAHADAILSRLRAGTMPCDGPWPSPQTDVLQRWTDTGKHR